MKDFEKKNRTIKKGGDRENAQAGKIGRPPVRLSLLGRRAGLRLTMADEHPARFTM